MVRSAFELSVDGLRSENASLRATLETVSSEADGMWREIAELHEVLALQDPPPGRALTAHGSRAGALLPTVHEVPAKDAAGLW